MTVLEGKKMGMKTEKARERVLIEKFEKLKLKNDILRGRYIEREKVKYLFDSLYVANKCALERLRRKLYEPLKDLIGDKLNRDVMQIVIDDEIHETLAIVKALVEREIIEAKK
jgi:hypothetical protein